MNGFEIILCVLSAILLITIVVAYFKGNTTSTIQYPSFNGNYNDIEKEVVKEINSYREENNINELKLHEKLTVECEEHSLYCIKKGIVSHDNVESRFSEIKSSLRVTKLGEVVSYGRKDAKRVVEGFKRSIEHNKVLLGNYTHMGISVKENHKGNIYVTIINANIK